MIVRFRCLEFRGTQKENSSSPNTHTQKQTNKKKRNELNGMIIEMIKKE
jgi:hypothetical protein